MAHSPAPWRLNNADTDKPLVDAAGNSIIRGVWYNTGDAGSEFVREEDGRLAEAAPDLLAACEAFVKAVQSHAMNYGPLSSPFEAARAAIAKAKGE